jgi:hypothetical protein
MEEDWREFRRRLADRLAGLEDGEMLFVDAHSGIDEEELDGATPYVQFRGWGQGMLRAEAVSNVYLATGHELGAEQEAALVDMGWCPVGTDLDGEPVEDEQNFHLDAPTEHADRLAVMAVRALREVYGCVHPAFLDADGLEPPAPTPMPAEAPAEGSGATGGAPCFPHDREELQELLDSALEVLFESPAEHDDDGDVPIVCGQSVAFVRAREDRPAVELFAELVVGVTDPAQVGDELDRLNRQDLDRQFFLRGESVVARSLVVAWPFVPDLVRACTRLFCDDLDEVAAELVQRIGGRRFLDPRPEPQEVAVPHTRVEVPPALRGLLELMQVGHVPSASVAVLFDHDRDELLAAIDAVRGGGVDLDGEGLEEGQVLDRLRRGLRVVVDRRARDRTQRVAPPDATSAGDRRRRRDRRRSQQLALQAEDEPVQEDLWGKEVS